ncbi:MAG: fused MFS/spermidine synthase [bacterium]
MTAVEDRPVLRRLVPVLFAVTGAAGLVYEVVWFKLLDAIFGVTALATATVLAVFMGGLGLGAAIAARRADRWERPLRAYGLLETSLGILAAAVPFALPLANRVFVGIYDALHPSLPVLSILRAVVSALILVPPATLMGMTLPVLARAFSREEGTAGDVGFLYTINTLGATLGAGLAGFVLLPALGLRATCAAAVATNLLVGATAILFGRGLRFAVPASTGAPSSSAAPRSSAEPTPAADPSSPSTAPPSPAAAAPRREWARPSLLLISALSGLTSLGYQVFWTRALVLSLDNTVYAFSVILVTVLVGITIGSAFATWLLRRAQRPAFALALSQALASLAVVALASLFDTLPARFLELSHRLGGGFGGFLAVTFAIAGAALLPATILLGMGLPLVLGAAIRGTRDLARGVGSLYSVNTWGAILGSVLAGFVVLPTIGIRNGIAVFAALNGVAAVMAMFLAPGPRARRLAAAGALAVALGALAAFLPRWDRAAFTSGASSSTLAQRAADPSDEIVYYREGVAATVSVKRRGGDYKLQVDGRTEATGQGDLKTNTMLGSLPLVLHQGPAKRVLVIGLGSGVTLGAVLSHPVERVECVELSEGVVEAARYFTAWHGDALHDPRVTLIRGDGRNHLLLTRERYDVIVSQPSNLWAAGVGNLFTREFFELCRDHLADGGILCQWIQGYSVSDESLRSVMRTITEVFPSVDAWVAEWSDVLLVASSKPAALPTARIAEAFGEPRVAAALQRAGVHDLPTFLSHFMLDRDALRTFSQSASFHTDDNRLVEMQEPRSLADGTARPQARALLAWQTDVRARLDRWPPAGESLAAADSALNRAIGARRHEIQARSLEAVGRGAMAVDEYRQAVMLNPEDLAIRRNLARHHVRMGVQLARSHDWRAAWDNFTEALRVDSTSADAWGDLGLLSQTSGQADAALEATRRAIALDPKNETYARQEGDVLRDERRWAEAAAAYRRALAIRGGEPRALLSLAFCLAKNGDATGAKAALAEARRAGAPREGVARVEPLLRASP